LSGADGSYRTKLIGSNALISLGATVIVALILIACKLLFPEAITILVTICFYLVSLLAFLNLPWNIALVVLQADRKYMQILVLKAINSGAFFLLYYFTFWL
jgi:hypothetical protein